MVDPSDVPAILTDAARLVRQGEIVVFGSAALAFWLDRAPRSRDIDLFCLPPERGDVLQAVMGELSWYHQRHSAYVEVWGPETFAAPTSWRERARIVAVIDAPDVRILAPHPHDILMSKLERMDPKDLDHVASILQQFPMSADRLGALAAEMPRTSAADPDRWKRFEAGLDLLRSRFFRG